MVIGEMTGNLPCREEMFEAENASNFESLHSSDKVPIISLHEHAVTLLRSSFSGAHNIIPPTDVSILDLHRVLLGKYIFPPRIVANFSIAFQSTVFLARTSCFASVSLKSIQRAIERWKELWDLALGKSGLDPGNLTGYVRRAEEIYWLMNIIIKISESGDMSSGYMRSIATDQLADIHDFISKYQYEKH